MGGGVEKDMEFTLTEIRLIIRFGSLSVNSSQPDSYSNFALNF